MFFWLPSQQIPYYKIRVFYNSLAVKAVICSYQLISQQHDKRMPWWQNIYPAENYMTVISNL